MKVYLAGIIPGGKELEQAKEWRTKVIQHYSNWKGSGSNYGTLSFLNPLNGEIETISEDGMTSCVPPKAILTKDYNAIKKCDLFVVNMNTFGVTRPPLGTILEIGMAWEARKVIMMITQDELYKKHPFVSNMVDWYFDSVEDMLEKKAINILYKSFNSAPY